MSFMSRWLDVEAGPEEATLAALPGALALLDLHNDGDYRLLVGDLGKDDTDTPKLKIFKGTQQTGEMSLPDLPVAVVGFYTTESMPRAAPVVAVALGAAIYIYKNMRLFYKYYLPSLELNAVEMDVWRQLTDFRSDDDDITKVVESLKCIPYNYLSPQSQKLLSLEPERYQDFIRQSKSTPLQKSSEVTCLATLKMNSVDKCAVSCLVLGTEDGDILFLDPQTYTQLHYAKICDVKMTPYQIIASGLYEVDFRITIATREKSICVLKREWSEGKCIVSLDEYAVAIEVMPGDNSIIVICMDGTLRCYNKKGKKQWSVALEHPPVALTTIPMSHLGTVLVGVALRSGHLQIYDGKTRVDSIFVKDVVSAMRFGQLGQEEHVLIIVTQAGDLILKILKRTADFQLPEDGGSGGAATASAAAVAHNKPWVIPKKSKLFLEHTARERENAGAMHKRFQLELNHTRLLAARALLDARRRSDHPLGVGDAEPVRLSAEVEGLGPVFRVLLVLENTSTDTAVSGLALLFHVHTSYKLNRPYIPVPTLVPGGRLTFPSTVEELFPEGPLAPDLLLRGVTGRGCSLRLLLLGRHLAPLLAATIQMPPTDPIMLPYDSHLV